MLILFFSFFISCYSDSKIVDHDGDGFTVLDGDCDETDPLIGPFDLDGDGVSGCGGDCDDQNPQISSIDYDGDGVSACGGDCDDSDPAIFVGAHQGSPQECARDADGDGFADMEAPQGGIAGDDCDDNNAELSPLDGDGDGQSTCAGDCDDSDPDTFFENV